VQPEEIACLKFAGLHQFFFCNRDVAWIRGENYQSNVLAISIPSLGHQRMAVLVQESITLHSTVYCKGLLEDMLSVLAPEELTIAFQ